jgi:hypothetical protein
MPPPMPLVLVLKVIIVWQMEFVSPVHLIMIVLPLLRGEEIWEVLVLVI